MHLVNNLTHFKMMFLELSAMTKNHSRNSVVSEAKRLDRGKLDFGLTWGQPMPVFQHS